MSPTVAAERWALTDRRDFLRRSLDDAELEYEAGDLTDTDYAALRRRDETRLAEVESRLATLEELAEQDGGGERDTIARSRRAARRRVRRRRRLWMVLVGAAALLAGLVILLVNLTSNRLPGGVATGGATPPSQQRAVAQELAQAAVLADQEKEATALHLYTEVLSSDPTQPTALAEAGWLEWASGSGAADTALEQQGRSLEEKAVTVARTFYAGHLYLGTIEYHEGDAAAAVAQYRLFLADHPASGWARDFGTEIRGAFSAVGQPVPPGVPKP